MLVKQIAMTFSMVFFLGAAQSNKAQASVAYVAQELARLAVTCTVAEAFFYGAAEDLTEKYNVSNPRIGSTWFHLAVTGPKTAISSGLKYAVPVTLAFVAISHIPFTGSALVLKPVAEIALSTALHYGYFKFFRYRAAIMGEHPTY